MFDAAGVAYPEAGWTWDDFLAICPTLQDQGVVPLALGRNWTHNHLWEAVALSELGVDGWNALWMGEKAFTDAGFSIIEADVLSSEWREYGEETESKITSKQLLRIARLRRNRERYIAEFGEKDYACELANCHYGVYQMLGKLSPIIYSLENSGDQ